MVKNEKKQVEKEINNLQKLLIKWHEDYPSCLTDEAIEHIKMIRDSYEKELFDQALELARRFRREIKSDFTLHGFDNWKSEVLSKEKFNKNWELVELKTKLRCMRIEYDYLLSIQNE